VCFPVRPSTYQYIHSVIHTNPVRTVLHQYILCYGTVPTFTDVYWYIPLCTTGHYPEKFMISKSKEVHYERQVRATNGALYYLVIS
jgi:hypothetical protein